MNPEIQPISPLDLAGTVMAAPAAVLMEVKVLVCLGVALICLACVNTLPPRVADKTTASADKQFEPGSFLVQSQWTQTLVRSKRPQASTKSWQN